MTRQDPASGGLEARRIGEPGTGPAVMVPEVALTQNAVSLANRMLAGLTPGDALLLCGLTSHRGVGALAMMALQAAAGLSGIRVLLVEAQSVHATAMGRYVPTGAPGFTDLLAGAPLTAAMLHATNQGPVQLMGVGTRPELAGAGSLMAASVGAAVAALCAEAGLVGLIGAPMRQSVGTASIAKHAQATVLCVHRAVDRRDTVVQAVADFSATGTRLLGTVLLR